MVLWRGQGEGITIDKRKDARCWMLVDAASGAWQSEREKSFMRSMVLAVTRAVSPILLVIFCAVLGEALDARLEISHLDKLASRAAQTVEVSLDERLLRIAAKFLRSEDPDEARIKELVSGLKGVYVRVFEFENPGEYS